MKVDFARAKAKRDSCLFYKKEIFSAQPVCEKIGYRRPFLATCHSCKRHAPLFSLHAQKAPQQKLERHCTVCGAVLFFPNLRIKRCVGSCRNNLFAYIPPRKVVVEEVQFDEDIYGVPVT